MNVKILGTAMVVTSSLTVKEIKELGHYNSEALTLKDDEGKPLFVINARIAGDSNFSRFGVQFEAGDSEDRAQVTEIIPAGTAEQKLEYVKARFGQPLLQLQQLEVSAHKAYEAVVESIGSVMENVEVE